MKNKICIVFSIICSFVFADGNFNITKDLINSYWDDVSSWDKGVSTFLKDNNYDYSWKSIKDKDLTTAWVEGASGDGIGEYVIIPVKGEYQYLYYEDNINNKNILISLKLNNGLCKSEKTFINNNRVKKAKITLYEVPVRFGQHDTEVLKEAYVMYDEEIELKDIMEEQTFDFISNPKASFDEGLFYLYAQLTILDVYPGEKFQDTCISEMSATAEVIN